MATILTSSVSFRGASVPRGSRQRHHALKPRGGLLVRAQAGSRAQAKAELLVLCNKVPGVGVRAGETERSAVVAAAESLEQCGSAVPKSASKGALQGALDGVWALEFTTTKESSAGKIGPFLGTVTQAVAVKKDKYLNKVALGPLQLTLAANWKVLDDNNWRVNFVDIAISLFGVEVKRIPFPPERGGYWCMTYTDEDLRILWTLPGESGPFAKGGKKEGSLDQRPANVFILSRMSSSVEGI